MIAYLYSILTSENEMDRNRLMEQTESIVKDGYDLFVTNLLKLMSDKYHLLLKRVIENVKKKKEKEKLFFHLF